LELRDNGKLKEIIDEAIGGEDIGGEGAKVLSP
jgi:hypothetical protein